MNSGELKRAKRAVRRRVLELRDAIDPTTRDRAGVVIARRVASLPEVSAAGTVMAFWSFGSEVPTAPLLALLRERGVRVALPRIEGSRLELRTWTPGDPVEATGFGAMEPVGGETVAPSVPDVVVTPAVAFDRTGRRVGYGGGFFDRLFDEVRPDAFRVGIAFDLQVVTEQLPAGAFDRTVDAVVTETEVVRCPRP